MGTSKGYDAPKSPQWKELKTTLTKTSKSGRATGGVAEKVISKYIGATKGNGISHGAGHFSSAIRVAGKIAPFFNSVRVQGLIGTLESAGIGNLDGKTANEIKLILMDYFCGDASSLQDVDVRNAFSDLYDELFREAEDYNDIERILSEHLNGDDYIRFVTKFFGHFIFQSFCRSFYEKLVTRIGEENASIYLNDIKDYIFSRVDGINIDRDITRIDWSGREGTHEIVEICNDVLDVFGGE